MWRMLSNPPPHLTHSVTFSWSPYNWPCLSLLINGFYIVICWLYCVVCFVCVLCFFCDRFHFRLLYDRICGPMKWYIMYECMCICTYVCMPVLVAVIKLNIDCMWRQETSLFLIHICWYSHYTYKSTWSLFYLTTVVCHILLPFCYIYIYGCRGVAGWAGLMVEVLVGELIIVR